MPLPANLLKLAEEHPCFSGVWSHDCSAECVTDPAQPAQTMAVLQCSDCLTYHVGADNQLLDPGTSGWQLASELTSHVRRHRGYSLSVGGYHTAGGGFWLSAAYWPRIGAFVLASRGSRAPLDALIDAIQHRVVTAPDPRMSQSSLYSVYDVHLSVVPPPRANSLGALLASSHVSSQPKRGYRPVTIAVFNPIAQGTSLRARSRALGPGPASPPSLASPSSRGTAQTTSQTAAASSPTPMLGSPAKARRAAGPRKIGDVCPVCGETVSERPLLHSTFIGCRCG